MKKIFKRVIISIALSPLILIFFYFTLNYIGFCFKECRFLSDEEKIDAGIKIAIERMYTDYEMANETYHLDPQYNIEYLKPKKNSTDTLISDEDIYRFKSENPNCCSLSKFYHDKNIEDYYPKISFWNRVFGWASDFVTVRFKYKDINGVEREGAKSVPITNCAEDRLSMLEATN
jgi:hypothetical protein